VPVDVSRVSWSAVLRLAMVISIIAALSAVALSAIGEVSQTAIVVTVMVVGFVASWVQTSRSTG
jgi:hypothetical protein